MASVGTIKTIDQLHLFTKTGTVVGEQSQTLTSLSATTTTTGGGGFIYEGTGRIDGPTTTTNISSHTSERLRLFVREDGGDEFEVEFRDVPFGLREGQRVTIVFAGDRAGHPMALFNHTTSKSHVFGKRAEWIIKRPGAGLALAMLVSFSFAMMLLWTLATGTGGAKPALYGAVVAVGLFALLQVRKSALAAKIVTRVAERARQADEEERTRTRAA